MNFKTPFKVLTTAALIGTLSLSTVAPGAAFAEETNQTTTATDQVAQENKLDAVIIEKDGKLYSLSPADYLKLKGSNDALLEGSKLKYLVSQGKSYNPQEFLTAKASNEQSVDKAFKSLDENDQEVADVTASPVTVDEEGNAVIGEEAAPVDKTALEAAIADAEKLEIADETAKAALAEAVKAAKEEAAKEEATQADIDKAVEALSKAVEAAKASIPVVVETVTAINSTQAAVTFTNAVKEVKPANVKVTDKAGNLVFVSKVEVEEGNKNATLTFVDKFQKDGEYKVTFTGLKDADGKEVAEQTATFKYEAAAVKEIKFTQTTVAPESDLKKYVTILDDLGRDVTEEHTVTFETANDKVVATDGKVGESGSVIVVAVVKDGDKVVKSAKTTIKVSAAAAAEYVGSYVYTGDAATNTEAFNKLKDEEKVSYIFEGDKAEQAKKLAVYYKDQYGNSVPVTSEFNGTTGAKLENLTPTVAIVENDSTIKPISKGTAYVKVTLGEIVQTIAIEVKEDAAITTMQVAPEAVSVVAGQDATSKVTFKNQYGKEQAAAANTVTVKAKDEKVATATFDAKTGDVTVKGVKEGSTTVTVTYKSGELELTKDIAVKVEKAGDLQEYKAVVKDTTLDAGNTNPVDDKKAPNSTTITVNQIDSNGNKIGAVEAEDVKLVEVDKDGKEVTEEDKKLVDFEGAKVTAKADKEGTAYVQVSVGSLVIDTVEIKVVNTAATATSVDFERLDVLVSDVKTGSVTVGGTKDIVIVDETGEAQPIDIAKKLTAIIKIVDQNGKVMENVKAKDITFSTTNANGLVVDNNQITKLTEVTQAASTVDVVVTEVKVAGNNKNLLATPTVVKFSVKQHVEAAPEDALTSVTLEEFNSTFLVAGLMKPDNTAQQPSDLVAVKAFIDNKYGVNFNKDAIKITTGADSKVVVSLDGSPLSTADWYKVKKNGVNSSPYRITLDGTNKKVKIAMYADGTAVIEDNR